MDSIKKARIDIDQKLVDIENSNKYNKIPKKLRSSNVSLEKPLRGSEE